jgi:hypothetical protein
MATIIIKLEHSNLLQHSREGVKIQKIVSSISPLTFIKLLFKADTKVNPRTATVNPITKSIYETLDKSPELFWYKTKGILLSTEECEILDRGRVRISLDNADYEGIMDGGHNTFAIARFIIDKLYGISFKTWDECKKFWDENYDNVLERFEQVKEQFKFSIPIEILSPSDEIGALDEFYDYISEICSARNNNVQLRETAKGNQVGYYEYLKDKLYDYKIIWKTGSIGKIKAEDVISLATFIGVRVMHFQRKEFVDKNREKKVRKYIVLIAVLTMCPAVYLTVGIIQDTFFESAANRFVNEQLAFENTQVLDKKIHHEGKHHEIRVVLIGQEVPEASIAIARSKMKDYKLDNTKLVVLQGMNNESLDMSSIRAMVMEDFYKNSEHSEYPTRAVRPLNSRMSKDKLEQMGFSRLPHWKDALERYWKEIAE